MDSCNVLKTPAGEGHLGSVGIGGGRSRVLLKPQLPGRADLVSTPAPECSAACKNWKCPFCPA